MKRELLETIDFCVTDIINTRIGLLLNANKLFTLHVLEAYAAGSDRITENVDESYGSTVRYNFNQEEIDHLVDVLKGETLDPMNVIDADWVPHSIEISDDALLHGDDIRNMKTKDIPFCYMTSNEEEGAFSINDGHWDDCLIVAIAKMLCK